MAHGAGDATTAECEVRVAAVAVCDLPRWEAHGPALLRLPSDNEASDQELPFLHELDGLFPASVVRALSQSDRYCAAS